MRDYAVVIGAGKSGCGFIGRLLAEEKVPFAAVDTDPQALLRVGEGYDVVFYGGERRLHIRPQGAYDAGAAGVDRVLSGARAVFVSVGFQNLRQAGALLAGRVGADCPVFVCENGSGAAEELRQGADVPLCAASAAIFCTTEWEDGAFHSQAFPWLYYDRPALGGREPAWGFLRGEDAFADLMVRKLYTYNAASAIICYLGWQKGYTLLADAANDPDILKDLRDFYRDISAAICREFGCPEEEQAAFAQMSLDKFTDRRITDTIRRNARNPLRKLTHNERIVGPCLLLRKYGYSTAVMERVLDAALDYAQCGGEPPAQEGRGV